MAVSAMSRQSGQGLDGFDRKILIISPGGPFLRRATGFQFQISNLRRPRNCCHKLHLQQPASADCGYKARKQLFTRAVND